MNKNFRQLASKKGPLSNWVQPDLPEDLCLLNSNKEPILLTQTHEAACEIYQETESEMKLFSMQGVAFQHFSNREPNLGWGYRDFSRR